MSALYDVVMAWARTIVGSKKFSVRIINPGATFSLVHIDREEGVTGRVVEYAVFQQHDCFCEYDTRFTYRQASGQRILFIEPPISGPTMFRLQVRTGSGRFGDRYVLCVPRHYDDGFERVDTGRRKRVRSVRRSLLNVGWTPEEIERLFAGVGPEHALSAAVVAGTAVSACCDGVKAWSLLENIAGSPDPVTAWSMARLPWPDNVTSGILERVVASAAELLRGRDL